MINKILMLFVLLIVSCTTHRIKGPNYNQGRSHNADKHYRALVVMKEDHRSKKAMIRTRKRASRCVKNSKQNKKHNNNKYIQ